MEELQVLAIVTALPGVLATLYAGVLIRAGLASRSWPALPGVVTRSEVIKLRPSGKSFQEFHYRPMLGFTFTVAEQPHTGTTIHAAQDSVAYPDPAQAAAVLAPYPLGAAVTVHHDPSDPSRSCLVPGPSARALRFGLVAAVLDAVTLMGAVSWVVGLLR